MPEYRVRVEIDVLADSPRLAAREAFELLRAPDCTPWYCDVKESQDALDEEHDQPPVGNAPWIGIDLETDHEEGGT